MIILWIVLGGLLAWAVMIYNGLVSLRLRAAGAWSDIDVQLKRRYELIPNLVSTVKGYASHENQVFTQITETRAKAMQSQNSKEKENTESAFSGSIQNLMAVAEKYPELKANQNFLSLQKSLSEIEDALQSARRYYNAMVRDFNTKQSVLPDVLIARLGGFQPKDFFQLDASEEARNPKIFFNQ